MSIVAESYDRCSSSFKTAQQEDRDEGVRKQGFSIFQKRENLSEKIP
jgi:hypothetical protein